MKEIGGYFGLEPLIENEYYKNLIAVNTARNALLYILKARRIKKLYIPYFLCDSISEMCDREGYTYEYYRVGFDFLPDFNVPLNKDEYIYIVNYYGQVSNEQVIQLKSKYERIIFDNVQAFFQKPVQGIDTIYSCRKFFGVPDGAYLSTDCLLNEEIPTDYSSARMRHLIGRFETDSATEYYSDFKSIDESFKKLSLKKMSKLTHNILGAIDYERVKKAREENFHVLHENLGMKNQLNISNPIGPYAYPLLINDGMRKKKALADRCIYIPTLWPNAVDLEDDIAKSFSENILPLPCDQRYHLSNIEELSKQVIQCINYEN